MPAERGKIRNREYAKQLNDFSGLRFKSITPTDIDAFFDFKNDVFILVESKYGDAEMPYGQRLALERLCDACQDAGRSSYLIQCSHNARGDIDYADSEVRACRHLYKWHTLEPATLRKAIERILEKKNMEEYLDA